MVSAICLINVSLMLQPNVFQVFQPIGGVRATPLLSAHADRGECVPTTVAATATTTRLRTDNHRDFHFIPPPQETIDGRRRSLGVTLTGN
ncbi:hypothetical protein [Micromonospora sp. NBC_01796]|uniref:hypothetical protein n=1 Tax=Micromonospora sp. NBC_01796 TaxID=2975987 RepID=UPI002DD85798|nr:hypothetical protein [Micromonospora sp. NBC_01796]WSA90090.1 hypothetical protein OIE47_37485 [Micromonospora sp. NBC_01796]